MQFSKLKPTLNMPFNQQNFKNSQPFSLEFCTLPLHEYNCLRKRTVQITDKIIKLIKLSVYLNDLVYNTSFDSFVHKEIRGLKYCSSILYDYYNNC